MWEPEFQFIDDKLDKFEADQKKNADFWKEKVEYTPEARVSIQNKLQEDREKTYDTKFKQPEKIKYFKYLSKLRFIYLFFEQNLLKFSEKSCCRCG